jgi:lysophospholipase L1-like esterase
MSWNKKSTSATTDPNSHTHSNKTTLDKIGETSGLLTFNGATIGSSGGTNGGVTASNLVVGGNVKFKVDFINKTIDFTTWNLWTTNASFTLNAGSKSFSAEMGTSTFYYVCYKSNTIELVSPSSIGTYTGIVIFGIMNTTVFPFAYQTNLIGVRGGSFFNRKDISIGEWTLIGDSITFGGWNTYVLEQFYVPVVTNLAINGRRMSGSSGMWVEKDNVTSTTELVTIMGGTNDQGNNVTIGSLLPVGSTFDTNTFIGAYQSLIEGLITRIPKIVIILITPSRAWTDGTGTTERTGMKDYVDAVKSIGQFYNLPVVDLYNNMGVNKLNQATFFNNDGLHPVDYGKRRLAGLVAGAIKNCWVSPV